MTYSSLFGKFNPLESGTFGDSIGLKLGVKSFCGFYRERWSWRLSTKPLPEF